MQHSFQTEYQHYMKKTRRSTFLKNFIRVMSCIVVFCTTYALILPAITMEGKTFCGFEEHVHSEKCYKRNQYNILICTPESIGVHTHNGDCYDSLGELVCTEPDYVIHSHNEDCYDANDYLICSIEEHHAHIHGNECYGVSGTDTVAVHQHSESCFVREQGDLACALEESEGHAHGDACYERVQVCSKEEGQEHVHDAACYDSEAGLICGVDENHFHDDSCFSQILKCELSEDPGHTHDDNCYNWTSNLVCTLEENQPEPTEPILICTVEEEPVHVHGESCFDRTKPEFVLLCTDLSENHVHNVQCYELDCGKEVHTHSAVCYSDPDADIETAKDWEKDFEDLELTGNWNNDVLTVAQTQLGYKESTRNYEVLPDESIRGYTRYGEWYGIPYGDWCAMFVSFCLEYAQVDSMPLSARVIPWIEELTELQLYHKRDNYTPKPGDLIFFDWNQNDSCDHVGLVAEIIEETEHELARIKTLEGNSSNRVQYVYYDLSDESIMGYSELPENEELYICGISGHLHNEYCYDENEQFVCEASEHLHMDACLAEPEDTIIDEIEEVTPVCFCGLEAHLHNEECFDENGNLNCLLEEHSHNEECFAEPETEPAEETRVFYCGLDDHAHIEDCYNEDGELICLLEEHTHNEECFAEPETESAEETQVFYCGLDEHTHIEDCYNEDGELICLLEEHAHNEACLAEPEPEAVEEPKVYYCGREAHVHENVCYGTEGTVVCPLKVHVHDAECEIPTTYQCQCTQHCHDDNCYSADGTLMCSLPEHLHTFVCDGYNCGIENHFHSSVCYNESNTLICKILEHEHSYLCKHYTCGKNVHIHGNWCYDVNSNLACGHEEHRHTGECLTFQLVYSDEDMIVTATITSVEVLPEDIELQVIPVTQSNAPEQFNSMSVAVSKELSSSNQHIAEATFFDLKLKSGGSFYTIPDTAMVTVTMEYKNPAFAAEDNAKAFVITSNSIANEASIPEERKPAVIDVILDSVADAVSGLFINASAAEFDENDMPNYQASGIASGANGSQSGIASVTSQGNQLPSFAFALTRDSSFSQYWERINSLEDLNEHLSKDLENDQSVDDRYIIVSAEGGYAMLGSTSSNAVPVTMIPIAGNDDVYSITINQDDVTLQNLLWKFEKSDNFYKIQNVGTSNQLYPQNNNLFGSGTCKVTYMSVQNCFRILQNTTDTNTNSKYHLSFHEGSGTNFKSSNSPNTNSSTSTQYSDSVKYYNARDMVIFRMLPTDSTYELPENYEFMASVPSAEQTENTKVPKPNYGTFNEDSEGDTGSADNVGNVSGQYYSDPAASKLEEHFRIAGEGTEVFEQHQLNDGMVRTDKSVIFGKDDYSAFSTYADNTFSVALSALGQAYPISQQYQLKTPVDVVFILDCSGSMSKYPEGNNKTKRAQSMVQALNASIEMIMQEHEANRVGVVFYAQGTDEVLPLGRYTANNQQYFINTSKKYATVSLTGAQSSIQIYPVYTGNSLKTEARYEEITDENRDSGYVKVASTDNTRVTYRLATAEERQNPDVKLYKLVEAASDKFKNLGANTYQGFGTYTQAGIAKGSEVFHNVSKEDTTYSVTVKGADNKDYLASVQRQPVFILLSDGEPTYSTPMYTDVLNAVDYADGNGDGGNVKGIHGFYTILSANHYKRMVGLHYDRPALFYSIGLGVDETNSGTTGNYKKAVLDPSETYLNILKSDNNYQDTSGQLLNLLNDAYTGQSIKTYAYWPDDWTDVPHLYEPTMKNQFADNFSYANGSFFGEYDSDELADKFEEIILNSSGTSEYGFVLIENTGVSMVDYIGAGMEIKGTPVLRYGGKNYTKPTLTETEETVTDSSGKPVKVSVRTYTYRQKYLDPYIPNDETVDLNTITVRITDNYPVEHIYMCGINLASHTHSEDECGIYYTYLCGHHSHRLSCHEGNKLDGQLTCDDPHDHSNCIPVLTTQKVELIIPDKALPVYMPDLQSKNFYYEALPVRLIYQVGLTADANTAVADLAEKGGTMTFYTNRWGGNQHARSDLYPSTENPFYYDQTYLDQETQQPVTKLHTYKPHTTYKGGEEILGDYDSNVTPEGMVNITGTEKYSVYCHEGSDLIQNESRQHVYHELGNNGKLVFSVDTIDIPVEKNWSKGTPEDEKEPVEVTLYRVTTSSDENEKPTAEVVSSVIISPSDDGEWSHTFAKMAKPDDSWYYAIVETPVEGYATTYANEEVNGVTFNVTTESDAVAADSGTDATQSVTNELYGVKIIVTEGENGIAEAQEAVITNVYQEYELPRTGGVGTDGFYLVGILLVLIGGTYAWYYESKQKRKRA